MWPYSNRGPRLDVEEGASKHKSDLDFSAFKRNDVSIKLWVSEKILTSIDVLCIHHEVSRPDILRWVFFEHAYGREKFAGLCAYAESERVAQEALKRMTPVDPDGGICFSRKAVDTARAVNQRFLGKATLDVKLWLPSKLKNDLQVLADAKKEGLSDYLRYVLVRHLFGELFYEELQQALEAINQSAVEHENPTRNGEGPEHFIEPAMWS